MRVMVRVRAQYTLRVSPVLNVCVARNAEIRWSPRGETARPAMPDCGGHWGRGSEPMRMHYAVGEPMRMQYTVV